MIDCEYYQNYKGPNLTLAQIWGDGEEREDITDHIQEFYGSNDWNGKLYSYSEIFPDKNNTYSFYVEFHGEDGRKHWFYGQVGYPNQYFNPPSKHQ
jgi:flavodoxin